jgi:hypothetical protein|tara:strand:- start:994 stop:1134 length:141 start_codon:yes stop_codon:yes gene_type:complete
MMSAINHHFRGTMDRGEFTGLSVSLGKTGAAWIEFNDWLQKDEQPR